MVGGGPIGCELAQAFRRLGSRVSLVEAMPRILLQDEPEASSLILDELAKEGVEFHLDAPVEKIGKTGQDLGGIQLTTSRGPISGDALLLAVGRRARLSGLELGRAGVDYGPTGIRVNRNLRTSRVPWTTFTDPEVAHIGLTEQQARDRYDQRIEVTNWPMAQVDRALTDGASAGFIKLVHQPNGRLLGATVVSQRAGEMIHEWSPSVTWQIPSTFIPPTPWRTCSFQQIRVSGLLSGTSGFHQKTGPSYALAKRS